MQKPFSWPLPIAAVWLILPVVGAVIAATLEPIPPHDYWWHLAMGRLIDASGTLPEANLFLYTLPPDEPFLNQPWLGQWAMWAAFDALGHGGTVWLRNVLLVAAFGLLVFTTWRRTTDARVTGALILLAGVLAYPVLTVRTRMFAFLPFVAVLWACFGVADGRLRRRWLVVAPLATLVWANTHGSFVLAPALVLGVGGSLAIEQWLEARTVDVKAVRDWGLAAVAVVVAGAATPHGFGVYAYVVQLAISSNVATSVSEWLPPNPAEGTGAIFAVAVAASLALLAVRRRSVRLYEVVVFAGMLYLSASAIRSMFWWAAAMPVAIGPHLAAIVPEPSGEEPSAGPGAVHAALAGGLVLLALAVQPGLGRTLAGQLADSGLARRAGEGAWILNHENAVELVDRIARDDRERVFHDQTLGGMLEFKLSEAQTPRQVAYVDQRMEFVPQRIWDRYFETGRAQNWESELQSHAVDTLLLSPESQWPLLQAALVSREWSVVGVGQSHLLLYRRGSFDRAEDPSKQDQAQDEEGDVDGGDDP